MNKQRNAEEINNIILTLEKSIDDLKNNENNPVLMLNSFLIERDYPNSFNFIKNELKFLVEEIDIDDELVQQLLIGSPRMLYNIFDKVNIFLCPKMEDLNDSVGWWFSITSQNFSKVSKIIYKSRVEAEYEGFMEIIKWINNNIDKIKV